MSTSGKNYPAVPGEIPGDLTSYLSQFVTERRLDLMRKVLDLRTRYLTVVLEDLYQPHNGSAVLRSCDGFGIQDVHVIENRNTFRGNPGIELGTSQWLSIEKYRPGNERADKISLRTASALRERGYRIVATTPHEGDTDLESFDLNRGKAAFFFGTEMKGLSEELIGEADEYLKIPMTGFVESFNISVSCAVILHHLTWRLRNSDLPWQLAEKEKGELLLEWLKKSVRRADLLEERFFADSPDNFFR